LLQKTQPRRLGQVEFHISGSADHISPFLKEGPEILCSVHGLLAKAVRNYPAAVGIELMNEPPAINRWKMYLTWQACYDAIRSESATLAVGIMDPTHTALPLGNLDLALSTVKWLKTGSHLFYAYHWYGTPNNVSTAVDNALKLSRGWGMPSLLTEYGGYGDPGPSGGCAVQAAAGAKGVGTAYWHYSDYCWPKHCPGGLPDGHCPLPAGERWGACITGWGSGNHNYICSNRETTDKFNDIIV